MKQSREGEIVAILTEDGAGGTAKDFCRRHRIGHGTYFQWKSK